MVTVNELSTHIHKLERGIGIGASTDALEELLADAVALLQMLEPLWPVIQPLVAGNLRQKVANHQARGYRERLNNMVQAVEALAHNPNSCTALLDLCRMADDWKQVRYD